MKPEPPRPNPQKYWTLIAAGEPFRLLFPLGAAIGIFGVLLWPLFVWNVTSFYPGQIHARIMIEGFLTSFVIGFLGTALPRLLDVSRLKLFESVGFAAALVAVTWLHVVGKMLWGDFVFLLTLVGLVVVLGTRFAKRRDLPPPSFVLVALGLGCALAGAALLVVSQVALSSLPVWALATGRLLLFQGFILLPIMGIGAFLLPRFFDRPSRQSFPESLSIPPGWKKEALFALSCGVVVVVSFFLEAAGEIRWGMALRAGGVLVYFLREVPFHRVNRGSGSLALGLRIALVSLPVGYGLTAVWPERMFSFLHLVFITGFGLLTFIVASRVVLGHSGQSRFFTAKLLSIRLLTVLLFLAMLTRVTADWFPTLRMSHYAYAAVAWIAGVLIWSAAFLPGMRKADVDA